MIPHLPLAGPESTFGCGVRSLPQCGRRITIYLRDKHRFFLICLYLRGTDTRRQPLLSRRVPLFARAITERAADGLGSANLA